MEEEGNGAAVLLDLNGCKSVGCCAGAVFFKLVDHKPPRISFMPLLYYRAFKMSIAQKSLLAVVFFYIPLEFDTRMCYSIIKRKTHR